MIKAYWKIKGEVVCKEWADFTCDFNTGKIYDKDGAEIEQYVLKYDEERTWRLFVRLPITYWTGCYWRTVTRQVPVHKLIVMSHPNFKYIDGNVIDHINDDHFDNRYENLQYITPEEHNRKTALGQAKWQDKIQASVKKYYEEHPDAKRGLSSEEQSELMKKLWAENREKMLEALQNDDVKAKRTASVKIALNDPAYKERMQELWQSEEWKELIRKNSKDMWENMSDEKKAERATKISEALTGHEVKQETRDKISEKNQGHEPPNKGLKCFNNGINNKYSKECPDGYVEGQLK